MIKVWILMFAYLGNGVMNPVPPLADYASCEKARNAIAYEYIKDKAKCVEVNIPAPSEIAWRLQGVAK